MHMLDKGAAAEMLGGKDHVTHLPDDKGTRHWVYTYPSGHNHFCSSLRLPPDRKRELL